MSDELAPTSPLEVLLTLMRKKWLAGDRDGAAALARSAAPYIHHRLASITRKPGELSEPRLLSDAELKRLLEQLAGGESATREDSELSD
jgi:hypothetical protein